MEDNKKRKSANKSFWMLILCVALTACIACVGVIGWYLWKQSEANQKYEDLKQEVSRETEEGKVTLEEVMSAEFNGCMDGEASAVPLDAKKQETGEEKNRIVNPIDFDRLSEINPEIYAWIEIPNTKIDYPILQNEENTYYLYHNMYREPEFAGCIYTERANQKDFSDPVTVIYGHNMKNGSMFQNLHRFEDTEFFDENPYVYIYTKGHKLIYKIFAAYMYDDRHILNSFEFKVQEVLQTYIDDIYEKNSVNGNLRSDRKVSADDRILTLSTCVGGMPNSRYLVQAVLESDEKTR